MMKHYLPQYILSFSLALASFFTANAESVDFKYCGDIATSVGSGVSGSMYGAAIKIDQATAEAFKGCSLESIIVGFGRGSKRDITLFMTYDLAEEPFMVYKTKLKAYNEMNTLPLESPYLVEGKPFYIGYRYTCVGKDAKPIAFDADKKYCNPDGAWLCIADDEAGLLSGWENYSASYGNLTIGCTMTGTLPKAYLYPTAMEYGDFCVPGQEFPVNVTVRNFGSEGAETATASFSLDNAEPTMVESSPGDAIPSGAEGVMTFRCSSETVGINLPFSIAIDKVGESKNPSSHLLTNTLTCSDDVFKRAVVFEEYTGIHCGNCVIGIVGLEYLNSHYDFEHDGLITIAAHQYSSSDPMYCSSYQPWLEGLGFFSAPNSVCNRTDFVYPSTNRLLDVYKNMRKWAKGKVSVEWEFADETHSAINVTTHSMFTENQDDTDYAIALVLVEDKVGPYPQTNYYDQDQSLPEFYGKGNPVKMLFNDVARYINCWNGAEASVLSSVEARKEYDYSEQLSLKPCSLIDNTRLVAMLIDRRTNEIINADMVKLSTTESAATVDGDSFSVTSGDGFIRLSGTGSADIFTVDGRNLGTFSAPCRIPAASGIHIIVPADGKTQKLMVR